MVWFLQSSFMRVHRLYNRPVGNWPAGDGAIEFKVVTLAMTEYYILPGKRLKLGLIFASWSLGLFPSGSDILAPWGYQVD